jgi:hypothetical protein
MPIGHRSFSKCHVVEKTSLGLEKGSNSTALRTLHGRGPESPQVRTVTQGCLYLLCPGLCSVCGPPLGQLCVWPATCVPVRLFDAATWDPPGEVARLHCAVLPHSPILAAWRGVEPLQLGSPVNRYVAKDMPTHISTQGGFETLALGSEASPSGWQPFPFGHGEAKSLQ